MCRKKSQQLQKKDHLLPFWGEKAGGVEGTWRNGSVFLIIVLTYCINIKTLGSCVTQSCQIRDVFTGSYKIFVTLLVRIIQDCNLDLEDKAQCSQNKQQQTPLCNEADKHAKGSGSEVLVHSPLYTMGRGWWEATESARRYQATAFVYKACYEVHQTNS